MPRGSTMLSRCRFVAREVNEYSQGFGYWIAVAQPGSWPDENTPPVYHNNLLQLPNMIGMAYVYECEAVTQDPTGVVAFASTAYSVVSDLTLNVMTASKAHHIWYEGYVTQDNLIAEASQYRAIAICKNVEFDNLTPQQIPGEFIPASSIQSYEVDWVATFTKVEATDNDTHTFRIVRTV